ncbi:ParA family protein [Paenibacillus popilliae]|uniref:ParA family protein n=1 Tax=Paenibacillus popilliae TaxID=78057 RepID=A0ABY3APR1_PAEPP|nr:ParA family protein [Paenibacillus sp. SDF0028]
MNRWDIVVAHPQKRILDGYTDYWKQSTYAEKLHLRVFTQADTLGHYLRLKPGIHVLVAAPELLGTLSSSDVRGIIVIALSAEKSEQLTEADFPCRIENPYQPIPQLFQSIIEYCESENASEGDKRSNTACRIVGITSTSGGAGKSTTAFHLSAAAAQSGLRPFLLNVDPIQEYSLLLQEAIEQNENQSNLAQLFYYLKKAQGGPGSELLSLDPYMLSVPAIGARMLHPKQLAEEWKWMDASMLRLLLNTLRSSGQYDLIIVEGAHFHSPFEAVWDVADQVMWLLLDDMAYIQKTKLLLQQWALAEESVVRHRSKLIRMGVNRYMGTMLNLWQQRDAPISGYLPYIPAWKQVYRFDQWLQSSVFRSTLEEWAGSELGLFSGAR